MPHSSQAKNLLIVDDNPGDINLLRQVIEKIPGIVLHIAHNVMQAHAYLHRMHPYVLAPVPDLILLDLHMPLISGESVILLVRRDPLLKNVKIIMLTSSSRLQDRESCDALGADGYVEKPRDWPQWEATINNVLLRYGMVHVEG